MGRQIRVCDVCGAEKPEFTVTSKRLSCVLEDLKQFDTDGTDHITKHLCKDCFIKIFSKPTGEVSIWSQWKDEPQPETTLTATENHYRPFKDCEELLKTYDKIFEKHTGIKPIECNLNRQYIWIRQKECKAENLIIAFDNHIKVDGKDTSCVSIQDMWLDMEDLVDRFEFLDGTPCGVLEE